jgi:carboxymethylenebutenolidase
MNTTRPVLWIAACALLAACGSPEEPAAAASTATATAATERRPEAAPVVEAASSAEAASTAVPLLEQQLAYGEAAHSNLVGYLAMPQDAAEPLPGIIVIHEWWGLNDDIKAVTRRLAAEGYVVLAVDLYGGKTATTPDVAQTLLSDFYADPDAARRNLQQAYDYLEKYAFAPRIASIGWDLGGEWSLQTALLYPGALDAAVMYYGGGVLTDRERLASLNVPLLGFFGANDKSVPVRQVQEFRARLLDLGKNAEILIVSQVDHSFANPASSNYNARAANEAWTSTLAFLERHLKLATPTAPR